MTMPSTEEIRARHREAERASAFCQANYASLMQAYPDQSIAVYDDKLVAAGKDTAELFERVRAAGYEPNNVWTFFVPAEPRRILL